MGVQASVFASLSGRMPKVIVGEGGYIKKKKNRRNDNAEQPALVSQPAKPADVKEDVPKKKKKKDTALAQPEESVPMKRKRAAAIEEVPEVAKSVKTDLATGSSGPKQRKQKNAGKEGNDGADDGKKKPAWNELRLFISGIPRDLDEDTVKKDFEECGAIQNFALLKDKTGESRGLAFVTFEDESGFNAALAYDGDDYGGQRLKVKKAAEKGTNPGSKLPEPGPKPEGCNSVVVRRLSPEVVEKDLKKAFKHCGNGPTKVGLLLDKFMGKSRCTARVDFDWEDATGVDDAMKLHGTELKGGAMVLDYCRPRLW